MYPHQDFDHQYFQRWKIRIYFYYSNLLFFSQSWSIFHVLEAISISFTMEGLGSLLLVTKIL